MVKNALNNKGYYETVFMLVMLLFPFIQQRTYGDLPSGYHGIVIAFYKYTSILSATCSYFMAFQNKKILRHTKFLLLFLAFWLVYLIAAILNSPMSLKNVIFHAYTEFALVLLITIACRKWLREFLSAAVFIYGGWIFMNLLLDFLYPNGLYHTTSYHTAHLLGDDNAMVYVMLPGLIIMVCNSIIKYGRLNLSTIFFMFVVSMSLLKVWAVSAFLSVLLFFGLLIYLFFFKRIDTRLLLLGLVGIAVVAFIGLNNSILQDFIVYKLDKDITLSGRTILWFYAIVEILERPFLGYGGFFEYGSWYIGDGSITMYPCHTPYLQLLLDGGFVLFTIFFILVLLANVKVNKKRDYLVGFILAVGLISMMFNYITEYSKFLHFFIIVTMMFNVDYLIINKTLKHKYEGSTICK